MFEIALGAILAQNVSWKNAEKALCRLKAEGMVEPDRLWRLPVGKLSEFIKSSGYYNQKAAKIRNFLVWFRAMGNSFEKPDAMELDLLRKELLSIRGIGPETADSILLYALSRKIFVVDAYTRRVFSRAGLIGYGYSYEKIQSFFHEYFNGGINEYNEYHALIVAHGKEVCRKSDTRGRYPACQSCCIEGLCGKKMS